MKTFLEKLLVFQDLSTDEFLIDMLTTDLSNASFKSRALKLAEDDGITGEILLFFLMNKIIEQDNVFTRLASKGTSPGFSLQRALENDWQVLHQICVFLKAAVKQDKKYLKKSIDRRKIIKKENGAWLSLVERLFREQEAVGSNPTATTKNY